MTARQTLLFFASMVPLLAQQDGSRVLGSITDPSGKAIPGAMVKLIGPAEQRTALTKSDGIFAFFQVPTGRYRVQVEAPGFAKVQSEDIRVEVQTPAWIELQLPLGEQRDTVTVTDSLSLLNRVDATQGNVFGAHQITQLPLEGRNVMALLSLQPGVAYVRDTNVIFRTNFGEADADQRNGSVNGGRSDQANVTLDGVDVNDQQTGFAFNTALRVGAETVREFRVVTAGANAEMGRSSGGQVAIVTRSGTNNLHGSLFHSHRNTVTSANSFFNNRAGIPRTKLVRNVFGGAVGGAILRNRLFFFGGYEGRRDASETSVLRNVPTRLFRDGSLRYRTRDNQIATLGPAEIRALDPRGIGANTGTVALLRQYPLPNDTPTLDPLNFGGYRFNSPLRDDWNSGTVRFDWSASARHSLFVRGNLQSDSNQAPLQLPGTPPPFLSRNTSKGFAVGHNWSISPAWVNALRYGHTFNKIEELGTTTAPLFSFGGGIGAPVPLTYSRGRIAPTDNLVNDTTFQHGRHHWQFGVNLRWIGNNRYNVEPNRALYVTQVSRLANRGAEIVPSNIAPNTNDDFVRAAIILMGVVSQGNTPVNYDRQGNVIPAGAPLRRDFRTNEAEFYVQDTWRLHPRLTVTAGLRYSLYSPVHERQGLAVRPTPAVGDWFKLRRAAAAAGRSGASAPPVSFDLSDGSASQGFYDWDINNFAPRLALAWQPAARWSIRGGTGLFYDRVGSASVPLYDSLGSFGLNSTQINPVGSVSVATAPRFRSLDATYPELAQPAPPFRFPLPYPRASAGSVGAIVPAPDATLRTPYSWTFNLSTQREFGSGWIVEAAYVGRISRNLLGLFDAAAPLNIRDPASGTSYFQAVNQLVGLGNVPLSGVAPAGYWENLFPGAATTASNLNRLFPAFSRLNPGMAPDTSLSPTQVAYFLFQQANPGNYLAALRSLDVTCQPACSTLGRYAFYDSQFASLFSWRSIVPASYHSGQFIVRKRFSESLTLDVNYTLGRSRDWVSGAERGDAFGGSFLINSWSPEQMEAVSDFDLTHQLNANWVATLPFGRGQRFGSGMSRSLDRLLGGWQISGITRWTSGFPVTVQNGIGFPTNHYFRGFGKQTGPRPETARNKNGPTGPSLFANPSEAALSFGSPLAGETGDRNNLRGDGLFTLDLGLSKFFALPRWEQARLALRAEAFNLTNSVRFDTRSLTLTTGQAGFGTYSRQTMSPRVLQFLLRLEF